MIRVSGKSGEGLSNGTVMYTQKTETGRWRCVTRECSAGGGSYRDLVGQCPLRAPRAQFAARRRQRPSPAVQALFTELTLHTLFRRPRLAACKITLVAKFASLRDRSDDSRTPHSTRGTNTNDASRGGRMVAEERRFVVVGGTGAPPFALRTVPPG